MAETDVIVEMIRRMATGETTAGDATAVGPVLTAARDWARASLLDDVSATYRALARLRGAVEALDSYEPSSGGDGRTGRGDRAVAV